MINECREERKKRNRKAENLEQLVDYTLFHVAMFTSARILFISLANTRRVAALRREICIICKTMAKRFSIKNIMNCAHCRISFIVSS